MLFQMLQQLKMTSFREMKSMTHDSVPSEVLKDSFQDCLKYSIFDTLFLSMLLMPKFQYYIF